MPSPCVAHILRRGRHLPTLFLSAQTLLAILISISLSAAEVRPDTRPAGMAELESVEGKIVEVKRMMRANDAKQQAVLKLGIDLLKHKGMQYAQVIGGPAPPLKAVEETPLDYTLRAYAHYGTLGLGELFGVGPLSGDQKTWVKIREVDNACADTAEELDIALAQLRVMRTRLLIALGRGGQPLERPEPGP